MRFRSLILSCSVLAVGLAAPSMAAAEANAKSGFFFFTKATHGYGFSFDISPNKKTASVMLGKGIRSGSMNATYEVKGKTRLTKAGRFSVDFGSFGAVRGRYVDRPGEPECSRNDRRSDASGIVSGSFRFRGEDGYASVSATRAKAFAHTYSCGGRRPPERVGLNRAASMLSCQPKEGLAYFAYESGDKVQHVGQSFERTSGVQIYRQTDFIGNASSFTHPNDLSAAALSPGGYFNGSAAVADGQLSGDLSVQFAGLGERALTPATAGVGNTKTGDIPRKCTKFLKSQR